MIFIAISTKNLFLLVPRNDILDFLVGQIKIVNTTRILQSLHIITSKDFLSHSAETSVQAKDIINKLDRLSVLWSCSKETSKLCI